jgi:chondroitin AC lyase
LKHIKYFLLFISTGITLGSFAQDKTISCVKKNLEDYYFSTKSGYGGLKSILGKLHRDTSASDQVTREVYEKKNADQQLVDKYISTINKDGSWPDINYNDTGRSGWEPSKHAERIFFLTKVYMDPDSKFYKDRNLDMILHKAMQFWFQAKLICPNWWYNEIGVPKTLGPAFIMLKDELSADEMKQAVDVMNNSRFRMTGQNKVWLAGNIFFKAILTDDKKLAQQARDTIASEIKITTEEGIQPDFSFHQHGPQQQFGNYGLAFITGMAFWGRIFDGTTLAFNAEQKTILRNLFNNGYNWINWKGYFDVNSLGRQFFKDAQVTKSLATGYAAADMLVTDPEHKQIYLDFISRNFSGSSQSLFNGDKHFWRSDMTVHRAPTWFSSIKMSSERVKGAEALNGENLKGYYVADGATYIMVDGNEYNNIFPVWNWRKLPGVTCYQSRAPLKVLTFDGYHNNSDFTGGLSNGLNGITAFHLVRDSLTAKKAWFFIDDVMVCLGADITSDKDEPVTTTLNQSFLKGDVYYFDGSVKKMSPESQISSDDFKWVYHNKIAYYPLQKTQLTFSDETQSGDWHDIAKVYSSKKQSAKIFSIDVEHGKSPQHESYSYVILPAITLGDVAGYKPTFTVIQNNAEAQILSSKNEKMDMFVIYHPVQKSIAGLGSIIFDQPGLYMLEKQLETWIMTATDPTHKLETLTFSLNGKKYQMKLPENGDLGKFITKKLN